MTHDDRISSLLVALLLAVGAGAWALALRPALHVDASPLASLPRQLGPWAARDVPLESNVEAMLRADYNVQRAYDHPLGDRVWVYFGYYGTERGGRPEHTPTQCYEAHGWKILDHRKIDEGSGLGVNEMVVSLDGKRELVHYWFRSFRATGLRGGLDQTLDRLLGRLLQGRADGSLVRVSTALHDDDLLPARSRLQSFARAFDAQLAAHWPREQTGLEPVAARVAATRR
ncbi:MAG: EpsI family protein [Deltaproteobacteria bacterium]|nr:EpsI family protein [Deltaproteobacteria bacterium]